MSSAIEAKRRALLELHLRRRQADAAEHDGITAIPRQDRLPCSYQQEGLWFLHQLDPASPGYHIPLAVRLRGPLDVGALGTALTALVARHESLRTRFEDDGGIPAAIIDPPPRTWPVPVVALPDEDVLAWLQTEAHLPFDLRTGPLLRSSLARVQPENHVLLLVAHHIVTDGWSVSVLTSELSEFYSAAIGAKPRPELAELTIQAVDHAAWQRQWLTSAQAERQISYWRETLENLETLELPADRAWPAERTGAGAVFRQRLPGGLVAAVRELGRSEQVSLLAVLLAGFLVVLHRYTGQQDLAVGSVFSGRTRTEVEPLVGYFAQTLVLRTSLAGDPGLGELVHRCHDTVVGAAAHQDVPFGLVVEALNPERIEDRNPLFQIGFALQTAAVQAEFRFGATRTEQLRTGWDQPQLDLAVSVTDNADETLDLVVKYGTDLFDADRIERLAEHFSTALTRLTADPGIRVSQCDVIAEAEQARLPRERDADSARYREAAGARRPVPALVPLQPDGTKPPLFFVHPIGGSVTPYFTLASLLGADQPFYGLEHPGLSGDTATWSISELAAGYLAAVLEAQSTGPYFLGGWSLGGVIAVEMARQLRGRGAEVAVVLMLDSSLPPVRNSSDQDASDQAELLSWFISDLAGLAEVATPSVDLTGLTPEQQIDVTLAALESAGLGFAQIREELRNRIRVFLANGRAFLAHQPDSYDGPLVLLRAADEPDDDTERWRALALGGFECYTVRGTHYTVLEEPHVTEIAGVMRRSLRDPSLPN